MSYNTITLNENELLQDFGIVDTSYLGTVYENEGNTSLKSWIANLILDNYSSGIISGELNTAIGDLKIGSFVIKNWAKGDVLQLGDIVRFNKNNGDPAVIDASNNPVYFKVTSRKFRYAGCPLIDIQFMQVK